MDARKIIYNHFFKPFENKTIGNVGCELEFPLINTNGGNVELEICTALLKKLEGEGFEAEITENGIPLFMVNRDGDCLSFDNSFNNFEFSMNHGDNILEIKARFDKLFEKIQDYFKEYNYELIGSGTNINKNEITQNPVPFSTYKMVDEFLNKFKGKHKITDFPAYISSVQTHLDVGIDDVPFMYTLFAKLDFVRAVLFSNSPDFEGKGYACYRDYLWENSAFGKAQNITGKVEGDFETIDELVEYFATKDMFNRKRNGHYEVFKPVNICEYFENPKYGATKEDIEQYLSFKNVELTRRGTLEIRSDCEQPLGEGFAPVAFNTGILVNADEAMELTEGFFEEQNINLSNTELRDMIISGKDFTKKIDEDFLSDFIYDLVEISAEGLRARGKGEEILLKPLYKRAVTLYPPAHERR